MKAVYVFWIRQIKRYIRSRSRVFGALGQPILFFLALSFGYGPVFQKAGEGNYLNFLAPGIIAQAVLFTGIFAGVDLIWDKQFGFLKETMVAPVSRFKIFFGRVLGGASIATFQGVIILLVTLLFGFRPVSMLRIFPAILIMFLISLFFTSLGTAIASKMSDFHGYQLITNVLVMPTFFLSGALFPLETSNKVLVWIAKLDLLTYGVDGLRTILIDRSHMSFFLDLFVLTLSTLIVLLVGTYLFNKIEIN